MRRRERGICVLLFFIFLSPVVGYGQDKIKVPITPLPHILNPDGTLKLGKGTQGNFDPTGYRLIAEPQRRPRFVHDLQTQDSGKPSVFGPSSGEGYWDERFTMVGATVRHIRAVAVSGNTMYVGGSFTTIGGVAARHIAKWDGSAWSSLGGGTNDTVAAITVSGTDVFVGGWFTRAGGTSANYIAKWNGSSWSALGSGMNDWVEAVAVMGTDIYAAGDFTTAGGVEANYIAKWNGSVWSPLGTGFNGGIWALAVIGTDLYAGGAFTTAGGNAIYCIAKWNGNSWAAVGSGVDGTVASFAVIGTDLYVGGWFTSAGGTSANYIAKWNGSVWASLGAGMNTLVWALTTNGTDVIAATAGAGATNKVAKWNGSAWTDLGTGMNDSVVDLAAYGTNIFAVGDFSKADGQVVNFVSRWNGAAWSSMGGTNGQGVAGSVYALAQGSGGIYAGGDLSAAGDQTANFIAKWDGSAWTPLGAGTNNTVWTIAVSGTDLYAGGAFTTAGGAAANYIAKWNGSAWTPLGTGMNDIVYAIAISGADLYAGGEFTTAGGAAANYIAKWNGSAWTPLGSGMNGSVWAIAVSGTDLYAGGEFTSAGGVAASRIAKWNGSAWTPLGAGANDLVKTIAIRGTDIYTGGYFSTAGGVASPSGAARWDGSAWTPLGSTNGYVNALAVSGTKLFGGGWFNPPLGGTGIAKWNGNGWANLGPNIDDDGYAVLISGTEIYSGGIFGFAGVQQSAHFAIWHYTVAVDSPNGGEVWTVGSARSITWTAQPSMTGVKIEYSTDGGSTWQLIVSSTPNDGSYDWVVPNPPSTDVLVRVSDAVDGDPFDTSDAPFTIPTSLKIISLSRHLLSFGAIAGGVSTKSQSVLVSNAGTGTLSWTASSDKSWLSGSPGSGTGTGVLQVSVNPAGLAVGTQSGTITVSDPYAANSPQTVNIALTVKGAGKSDLPFGDFATPINGTTGITGAIPVTGWVLDDVETKKVEIWRDPIGTEGSSLVYIGDGIFVEGARPDVETAYPAYPFNYRAGWGYMLLTNFLPAQGNGTYKLHAFATDKEGNQLLLGTKTIVCDNAHAVKPFGTIDTPAQGGDTSGNPFVNFGWVLTPMPKTVPKDGSTIEVYVDGAKLGNLATAPNVYNQYRVDVSTNFPGFNNTGGPGAGGPVGAFYLDTTKLTNGVHTIYWIATDDAGAADGIGSRYFNVVNTGTSASSARHREERSDAAIPTIESLSNLPLSFDPLNIKRGFNLTAPPETVIPDTYGSIHIEIREVERVEIDLGKGTSYRGSLVVGGQLRPLPIGSTLDPFTGTFSWLPGPGFIGAYDLVFIREAGSGMIRRIPIKVTIKPKF